MVKSYVSKVAGFYRSNHRMRSVKTVFLERYSQNSQEKAFVRDSTLLKLHSQGCKKETLAQVFSCEFLRTLFLQNTSERLLLLLAFQKQPPEVFYENRCSWKFRKIHRKIPVVCEIFQSTFFYRTPQAFLCNVTKMGYYQQSLENLRWIFII